MASFIGLDLGTSALKAVLIDADQIVLAEASAPLTVQRPHDGWSEQDPAAWIAATETAMDALAADHDLSAVQGIGLSGQQHGATLLDARDRPLRPCILWNDTRSHAEAAAMDADPSWRTVTGNIVFPGFTAPKLAWTKAHEPDVFARVARVLLPKDYLRLWLTGEAVADLSDASGTGWLDVGARDWSDALLARTDLGRAQMPRLVEGSDVSGALRPALAERWGMGRDVAVAGGAGDNAASAVGLGVARAGQGFVSLGTSGVMFTASERFHPAPESAAHSFCHALPGLWHQMSVHLSAADSLSWLSGVMGRPPAALVAEIGDLRAPGPVVFLPYLGGERTPLNDARIRAGFAGIAHAADAAALTRAVLEGVAFSLRDGRAALEAAGARLDGALLAVGGGARSEAWLAIIANALQTPVATAAGAEVGAALGAARLGMMAATGEGAEIATPPPVARVFDPDPALADAFATGYARFRAAQAAAQRYAAETSPTGPSS
jgi:xylulokinase